MLFSLNLNKYVCNHFDPDPSLPFGNLELDPFDLVGVLLPLLPLPLLGLLLVHHLLLLGVHQLKPLGSDN